MKNSQRNPLLFSMFAISVLMVGSVIAAQSSGVFARSDETTREQKIKDIAEFLRNNDGILGELLDLRHRLDFGVVPVGAMIPYFGNELPKGYCWANGDSTWPDAAWVPEQLEKQSVPNMDGWLLGGTADPKSVGTEWSDGKLVVSGSAFTIPAGNKLENVYDNMVQWKKGPAIPKTFQTQKDGIAQIDPQIAVRDVSFDFENKSLNGEVNLKLNSPDSNPRHLRCRWIIRIE